MNPEQQQSRILRALSRLLVLLLIILSIVTACFYIFISAAGRYTAQQAQSRDPLHNTQLETYYENRQFGQMAAYLQRYNLYDAEFLKYNQAVQMASQMDEFRNDAFEISRYSYDDLLSDTAAMENTLLMAYQLYTYEERSEYAMLVTPNDQLLSEFQTEVSLTLTTILQLSALEIATIQKDEFWQGEYVGGFLDRIQERLVIADE